jgi:hypothetical protein
VQTVQTVTSFHGSAVPPDRLSAIMADYLALEHARVFRRLLVVRCGLLALAIVAARLAFGGLPRFPWMFGASLCLAAPSAAWLVELRRARQLTHRLEHTPGRVEHVLRPPFE